MATKDEYEGGNAASGLRERGAAGFESVGRRTLLRAVGAGAALSAAGLAQAGGTEGGHESNQEDDEEGYGEDEQDWGDNEEREASCEDVHPVFGFSALSADVEAPVEPDHEVQALVRPREGAPIPEFYFEPAGLAIEPGDTVKFTMTTPHHNVVAYHPGFGYVQRVPDGVPPFSGPLLPAGGYWLYTFEEEGVYEMNCAPHEVFGMVMRLVVGDVAGPAADPLPDLCAQPPAEGNDAAGDEGEQDGDDGDGTDESETEPDAGGEEELRLPPFTAYTVLTDPALDPETIAEQGSVSWDDLSEDSKQLFLQVSGFPPCEDE